MKPPFSTIAPYAPGVDERLVNEHLRRLDDSYFAAFDAPAIGEHLRALAGLTPDEPVAVLLGADSVTILGFDHPSTFSLICGVLASSGFSILSGAVFTYEPAAPQPRAIRPARDAFGRPVLDPLRRRRIIDHFRVRGGRSEQLRPRLHEVMRLLEREQPGAARQRVNEWVTEHLRQQTAEPAHALYPVQVEVDNSSGAFTRLRVSSQDTPAFLYAFSTGLSLHGVSIERVRIDTANGTVQDELDVVGVDGGPLDQPTLDLVRVAAVLTKHFTYFLDGAPDPSAALDRFKVLVQDVLNRRGVQWLEALSDPQAMHGLARVLGASDFLWEDFVRLQYETLLPFLHVTPGGQPLSEWLDAAPARFDEALASAASFDDKRACLNAIKDREAFMIDLEHVLSGGRDLRRLSARLTSLAERVVRAASEAVYQHLIEIKGPVAARYAIFGLGKLGGGALGYASDIELLLVYSGSSGGAFFADLMQDLTRFIEAKQEGLFQIDLKLRPFGVDGPLASSVEGFGNYYGPGGPAHSLERLSLTRLRAIAGDAELGREVERLRDEALYGHPSLNLDELRTTRALQFAQKNRTGVYNAKYSPGALVDVEYAAEILQVLYGKNEPRLRTPRTEDALRALAAIDVINGDDLEQMLGAYDFLGRLINGLRMLRGWAGDLFLPPVESEEFGHLARRMGYEGHGGLSASQELDVELQSRTAAVRAFVERRFGPAGLPGPVVANVADLVLSDRLPGDVRQRVLREAGFSDAVRSYANLRRLAGEDTRRKLFAELVVLACQVIRQQADPDGVLDRWRRHVDELADPEAHFRELLDDPRRLEALAK